MTEERRERLRKSDIILKVILILFGIIQTGIGWGLKEIYTTLKEHDRAIFSISAQTVSSKELITVLQVLSNESRQTVTTLQERSLNMEGQLGTLQGGITKRLDRMESKLDQIIETGILNGNVKRRW